MSALPDRAVLEAACLEACALHEAGQLDAALVRMRRLLSLLPGSAELQNSYGCVLCELGRAAEALPHFRQAVALQPGYAEAHMNVGLVRLMHGAAAEGWREYAWRWRMPAYAHARSSLPAPEWAGEAGQGGRLLIHAEQGLGDTLQFCRLAPLAAARGWRVALAVQAPLVRLLQGLPGVASVVVQGDERPPHDVHCPLLTLPLALGLDGPPDAAPYLAADRALAAAWRQRLAGVTGGLRVGVAWAGGTLLRAAGRRSLPPGLLAPVAALPRVRLVSLQKDGPAAPAELGVVDPTAALADFAETAALIANLDLVVCVDTAVAHLAGAMGKPVWLLDRFDHCWRWQAGRRDSAWYPTLRIYRQPVPGAWDAVIAAVVRDLRRIGGG